MATLEEHSVLGGLGGAVAEVLAEAGLPGVRFRRLGLPSAFTSEVGDQEYLLKCHGLHPAGVADALEALVRG